MPAMSNVIKDPGIGAVQAAVAASTDKAEMHKCNEYRGRFGQGVRQRVPVHMLVPHPDNRSGVFPSSTRVRELACQIIVLGFSQAEADFEGVCVRDYTADQLKERPGYKSFAQNVAEKAKGCVKELYQHGYGEALFGTLSHTHLAVILRAIAAGVKWEIPKDDLTSDQLKQLEPYKEKGTGLLMMSAVADRDEVAKKLVTEGMLMDVLDARIMHEAPSACTTISATLNKPQAFAMRMTELEVLKVLSREIWDLKENGEITYQSVMAAVGTKLGPWVSDPDFLDFFNFILNLGADGGPHIRGLINFVEERVNSSKRALRLGAFAQVGALRTEFPRVKVALIMRAYRLPPKRAMVGAPGWCPEPEATWKKPLMEPQLRLMEGVLHTHYVTLRSQIVDLLGGFLEGKTTPKNAAAVEALLANISIQTACAMYFVTKEKEQTAKKGREALLQGCQAAYTATLPEDGVTKLMELVKALPGYDWFDFATLPEGTKAAEAAQAKGDAAESKPTVITFNAATGAPENEQATMAKEEKKGEWMPLPLCEWLTRAPAKNMGKKEAYMGAVVQVLWQKHLDICGVADTCKDEDFPLGIMQHTTSNHIKVISRAAVAARKLELWPCVPKTCKVCSDSVHPDKVHVQVWEKDAEELNKSSFYLNPEFALPEGRTASDVERSDPLQRAWTWTGKETMHPYWCVTKLTDEDLAKRNAARKEGPRLRFNVSATRKEINMVKCHRVFTISIPVLTNAEELEKGEELIMQVQPRKKKEAAPQDWRGQERKRQKRGEPSKSEHKADFDNTGKMSI